MSVAEKNKLKEIGESMDRMTGTQKRIMEDLKKIKIDEFRGKIDDIAKQISMKAEKAVYDPKFVDILQQITKTNEKMADLTQDVNRNA